MHDATTVRQAQAELELRRRRRVLNSTLEARRAFWRTNYIEYCREALNVTLTPDQERIFESVIKNRRTAVKASHAIGKTFIAAVILCWWYDCWAQHIGYITAPTWQQANGLTFKQTKLLRLENRLGGEILDSGWVRDWDRLAANYHYIRTLNAEKGEGFQGEHTSPILIIIEEAVGVPGYIWNASEGLMTMPQNRILAIGNPTDQATKFGDICDMQNWEIFSISALDHPNIHRELRCEPPAYENAVRLLWLCEMLENECDVVEDFIEDCFEFYDLESVRGAVNGIPVPDIVYNEEGKIDRKLSHYSVYKPSAEFQGRVLGEFPTEASNKVIPIGWLRHLPIDILPPEMNQTSILEIEIGSDVASFGDDRTTIFSRWRNIALKGKEVRKFDNLEVASAIKDLIKETFEYLKVEFNLYIAKKLKIKIDITGGLGTGPHDLLKSEGYNVIPINSSETAEHKALYKNKRSELWFTVRDRIKVKNLDISRLPLDIRRKLRKELGTPMYAIKGGKKVVEDKSETKKKLLFSPDLADGFNLAFYEGTPKITRTKLSRFAR